MIPDPAVTILWNEGTVGEWGRHYAAIPRSTLPQSFGYASAMAKTRGYVPRLGLIQQGERSIGLVQVLQRHSLKLFRQTHIHRGPLWLGETPAPETAEAVFRLLRREYPNHLFSRVSLLPELPASPEMTAMLERCGFRRIAPGYQTVWLDLSLKPEAIRARFTGPWRKGLRAAEAAGLALDVDPAAQNLPWLVRQDQKQAESKGYRSASGTLIVRLRNALHKAGGVLMVTALAGKEPVAAALLFIHGQAATYQVGWSNEAGRKSNAMRLVLWRAIEELKKRGVTALDLGGINPEDAPGVTEFKLGLGGEAVETLGLFR
ncbi:GNAT family N-acetyltransferase [Azospirillum palustre]|uniref:GNAT family N-acetyltransferase n=2 Tax=Azospirillum palustre TaxID=2044885 RepID=A0A2B8BJ12_9PROT|nr:GNAT family N-acetyltransferase [Azospirillum palustre]